MPDERRQYAELAELAGSFIHEIKNHLSTLGLNLQLLAEDFQNPQNQRERRALDRAQRLQDECQRLVEVSNDFLRFARIKELDFQPTSLSKVVEELLDFFEPSARQANIDIKCHLPADLPRVSLDRDLFKQALLNLLLNAQQAMPGGGHITIQAKTIADCESRIADSSDQSAIRNPQSAIELCLIDTGKGMSPEVVAKAFKPFFSTRSGGSGLGLPTTRKIIEAHGGTIELESAEGRGTKFTIHLPVVV
jgi:two-component system, NtrC family, sensor histidine kinase HydH